MEIERGSTTPNVESKPKQGIIDLSAVIDQDVPIVSEAARLEYQTIFRLLCPKPANSSSNSNNNNATRNAKQSAPYIDFHHLKRLAKEYEEKISDEHLLWMLSLTGTGRVYEEDFVSIMERAKMREAESSSGKKKARASPKPREKKPVAKSISKRTPKKASDREKKEKPEKIKKSAKKEKESKSEKSKQAKKNKKTKKSESEESSEESSEEGKKKKRSRGTAKDKESDKKKKKTASKRSKKKAKKKSSSEETVGSESSESSEESVKQLREKSKRSPAKRNTAKSKEESPAKKREKKEDKSPATKKRTSANSKESNRLVKEKNTISLSSDDEERIEDLNIDGELSIGTSRGEKSTSKGTTASPFISENNSRSARVGKEEEKSDSILSISDSSDSDFEA